MSRTLILLFGAAVYAVFLPTFLYAVGFVGDVLVPRSVDAGGPASSLTEALLVNVGILGLFAVQHSIMARQWFKRRWTKVVSPAIERSIFVAITCGILGLMYWQWRPIGDVVWDVQNPVGRGLLTAGFWGGMGLVLYATFLIDHFHLFGLKQVITHFRGRGDAEPRFAVRSLYRHTRHPLYLGFVLGFWSAPTMTAGHLLFAAVTTAYILVAIQLEERDLVGIHGDDYRQYRRQVPMLLPGPKPAPKQVPQAS